MVTINLTKKQHETLLELIQRGFAYMDEHQGCYRDWGKMVKVEQIVKEYGRRYI